MNQTSDIELINRVLKGEVSAYAMLVDRYKDMAFTVAYRIAGNREDAEEIAQDAFLKAYRNLKKFRGKAKFTTWLYRIVYNTAVSVKRLKKIPATSLEEAKHPGLAIQEDSETDEWIQTTERAAVLEKALNSLNEAERTIITLYYLNGSSIEDIHTITGLSAANVKVRLFRARKKMQVVLSGISSFAYA